MSLSRREALAIAAGGAALAASGGCRRILRPLEGDSLPVSIDLPVSDATAEMRLLNRSGFGPRPGDLAMLAEKGTDSWIEEQLKGELEEPLHLEFEVNQMDIFHLDAQDLEDLSMEEVIEQLQQAQLLTAVYSRNQLRQRMADFWTNHFNIYSKKLDSSFRLGSDNWSVIRKHSLGNFGDMVRASAKSPAMLGYLDNDVNKKGVANENYARELMELHTLGVDGGYTQKDIQEVARCFTGWTIESRFLRPRNIARFDPELHDDGSKLVFGKRIPAGLGAKDAELVVDILLKHPSTPKFLAKKLSKYFLGTRNEVVERQITKAYAESKGSISAMLRPILVNDELENAPPILKRPFDFVVSALRAIDADTLAGAELLNQLRQMGQPGYEWPMPDGYPVDTDSWTGSLLARWNFATRLSENAFGDTQPRLAILKEKFEGSEIDLMTSLFFGVSSNHESVKQMEPLLKRKLSSNREKRLIEAASLCICAPEFQWR